MIDDERRVDRLYQMALRAHMGSAAWSLRAAALDGIHAEVVKQPAVLDWLRARMVLGMEPFTVIGDGGETWWMVLVRDDSISPGAMRGSPAPTVEESAASALVWHLAAVVARAFATAPPTLPCGCTGGMDCERCKFP